MHSEIAYFAKNCGFCKFAAEIMQNPSIAYTRPIELNHNLTASCTYPLM